MSTWAAVVSKNAQTSVPTTPNIQSSHSKNNVLKSNDDFPELPNQNSKPVNQISKSDQISNKPTISKSEANDNRAVEPIQDNQSVKEEIQDSVEKKPDQNSFRNSKYSDRNTRQNRYNDQNKNRKYNERPHSNTDNNKNKVFQERLEDDKQRYLNKFKEPKDKLCFDIKQGDLFLTDPDTSLAHCVSEDFKMGAGIATEFRNRFKRVDELCSQNVTTGGCAYIKHENRYVFYLVTKKFYNFKPYYNSLEKSLTELRKHCQSLNVSKLAMPKIGSGLDKLEWDVVTRIIDDVFAKTNIAITIYEFKKENENRNRAKPEQN